MPSLPTVAETARVNLVWSDGVGTWGSRFFVNYGTGVPTGAELVSFASVVQTLWSDHMAAVTSEDYALTEVEVRDLATDTGLTGTWTGSETGSIADAALPSNVSCDIHMPIPPHYRGGKPVLHHPPATAAQLSSTRQWSTAFQTEFNTAVDAFSGDIDAAELLTGQPVTWVVLRGYQAGKTPEEVSQWQPQSFTLRAYIGTMRRRGRAPR